jgi:hypothetical protein
MKVRLWAATGAAALVAGGLLTAGLGSATASSDSKHGWRLAGASSAADGVSSDITTAKTIRLVAHEEAFKLINVGSHRFSPGDYFVFEETLRDRDSGQVVGRDSVKCTVNFTTFMCQGTFLLDGKGNVEISGSLREHGKQLLAVTGGTESYQNARGQLRVGEESGGNTNLTLELLP